MTRWRQTPFWYMRTLRISFIFLLLAQSGFAAIRCNSTSDAFTATTFLPTNTSYTMMAWFNLVVDKNAAAGLLDYGSGTSEMELQADSDGTTLIIWDGADAGTGPALVIGRWYHIAITYDDSNARAYVNGSLVITNANTDEPTTTIRVGNSAGTEFLNGRFNCVKMWSTVLSQDQIANEMPHCRPMRTQDLNRWQPAVSNVLAADALDKSGRAANFTVTSTPIVENDSPPVGW